MQFKDYYEILGVTRQATDAEIKSTYRKLAKKFHPDKNPGNKRAEERFKEINEAYEVLSNPQNRQKYDTLGANWNKQQFSGFDNFGGQNGGFSFDGNGAFGGFSDFFKSFFGGGGGTTQDFSSRQSRGGRKGRDSEAEVILTLNEVMTGTERFISTGSEKIKVNIKPGVTDGQKLKLPGKGGQGSGGNGDLILNFKIAKHPHFKQKNYNLETELPVDLYTAVLGGKVTFQTLTSKISLTIQPETSSGKILKLSGLGLSDYADNSKKGDLLVKIIVTVPQNLSDKEKELFKKLADLRK